MTLRLRVTDDLGNVGEDTRVVSVFHDPDLHPGFPLFLNGSGDSSPALADLDGDGNLDIVLATAAGEVHAFTASGAELPGWPVTTDLDSLHTGSAGFTSGAVSALVHESVLSSAAVGDLDRDGTFEVVVASTQGKVYVFSSTGALRPGFPVSTNPAFSDPAIRNEANRLDPGIFATPALADLDRDGALEIIVGSLDRHLYVWRADGTPQPGFPILMVDRTVTTVNPLNDQVTWNLVGGQPRGSRGTKIVGSPAVGDIDGDGFLEIVQGTNEEYVRGESGNVKLTLFASLVGLAPINGRVYAVDHQGSLSPRVAGNPAGPYLPGWPVKIAIFTDDLLPTVGHGVSQGAALGDLDGDGIDEVVVQGNNGPVYVLRGDGTSFYGLASSGEYVTLDYDLAQFRPLQAEFDRLAAESRAPRQPEPRRLGRRRQPRGHCRWGRNDQVHRRAGAGTSGAGRPPDPRCGGRRPRTRSRRIRASSRTSCSSGTRPCSTSTATASPRSCRGTAAASCTP